jgi:hypothetical protein
METGVVAMITNNSFLLMASRTAKCASTWGKPLMIYTFSNLHGNSNKKEKAPDGEKGRKRICYPARGSDFYLRTQDTPQREFGEGQITLNFYGKQADKV